MVFCNAEWIWIKNTEAQVNEYAEFKTYFNLLSCNKSQVKIRICAKSEYILYINENLCGGFQFGDFPDEKVYDEYDISTLVKQGKNSIAIRALSKNYNTCNHITDGKGVIFEVLSDDKVLISSSENVLSRLSKTYKSGELHKLSGQLGMTYYYDFTKEDNWLISDVDFVKSVVSGKKTKFTIYPIKKFVVKDFCPFKLLKNDIYDGDRETVGYLKFSFLSEEEKEISIKYGEHISDGNVRAKINGRDFTLHFKLKKGENLFFGPFLRLGARYFEIENGANIKVNYLGLLKAEYPVKTENPGKIEIPEEIYNTSIYTLKCCMHNHYEDCPWREQGQYTMDSRTQILCGYYAFNEVDMPASSIVAMSHRLTKQNVLPITSPSNAELSIPSFSLIYPLILREYYDFTKDKQVLLKVYDKTKIVIEHYISNMVDGMIPALAEWNFFEWSDEMHNDDEISKQTYNASKFSLPVNAFFIIALENFAYVCKILGKNGDKYINIAKKVRELSRGKFLSDNGLFATYEENGKKWTYSEYTQVMACYAHIASEEETIKILKLLTEKNNLIPLTLSSHIFKYEVMMRYPGFKDYIIDDVKSKWGYMLEQGATTFWETLNGDGDFCKAGSLCHGWSAIPVYVAWKLKELK